MNRLFVRANSVARFQSYPRKIKFNGILSQKRSFGGHSDHGHGGHGHGGPHVPEFHDKLGKFLLVR